jgi:hypothetical protein
MELREKSGGAGDGNRTHVTSLEGWSSTIELHPLGELVGRRGFEPLKAVPTDLQSVPFGHFGISPGSQWLSDAFQASKNCS